MPMSMRNFLARVFQVMMFLYDNQSTRRSSWFLARTGLRISGCSLLIRLYTYSLENLFSYLLPVTRACMVNNSFGRDASPSPEICIIVEWVANELVNLRGTLNFRPLFGGDTPKCPAFTALSNAVGLIFLSLGLLRIFLLIFAAIVRAPYPFFPLRSGLERTSL